MEGTVEFHGVETSLANALDLAGHTADAAQIIEASTLIDRARVTDASETGETSASAEGLAVCEQLEAEATALHEELSAVGELRSEMEGRLTSAIARLDRSTGCYLDRADGELGRAALLLDRADRWTGMAEPEARVALLESSIVTLDAQLLELPSGDRAVLVAAVGPARVAISVGEVPCPSSSALAEAWLSLHQRLEGLESRIEASGHGAKAAAVRLDAAQAAARSAADEAMPRSVTASEADRLEELHDRFLTMEVKAGRSIRWGAARKGFEEAQQASSKALGEIGYSTWAAFRMGNGLTTISPAKLDENARALEELDRAEAEHAELMGGVEQATELQSVLSAIDTALDHAVALLARDPYAEVVVGGPNLLTDALRSQTIDAGSLCIDRDDALSHLRQVLEEAGCCGHAEVNSEPGLVALAKSWLAVLESADVAAVRILRERERAATELDGLCHPATGPNGGCLDHERGAVAAAVPRGLAGPIPLIVLLSDAPLTALESVLELPDDVQILVLGDTEGMAEWAAAFPQEVAHCVEIGAVV